MMSEVGQMLLALVLSLTPSIAMAIVLHELGHALFGAIGGYRCYGIVCFGRAIIIRRERIITRRTAKFIAGRCFLVPNASKTIPGLAVGGGCLMNIGISGMTLSVMSIVSCSPAVKGILFAASVVNLTLGLANYIGGTGTADGPTLREICHISGAGMCYDRILLLEKMMADGKSIVDAQEEWLIVPEGCYGTLSLELGIYSYQALTERYTGCFGYEYLDHRLKQLERNRDASLFAEELNAERERLEKRRKAGQERWVS